MSFTDAVKVCFSKYADFSGRARRSEFWFFYLFTILYSFAVSILSAVDVAVGVPLFSALGAIGSLALIIPSLAVSVRRLHDTGRSGWQLVFWYVVPWLLIIPIAILLGLGGALFGGADPTSAALTAIAAFGVALLLPLVGAIVLFVYFVSDTKPGENKYGPAPKGFNEF